MSMVAKGLAGVVVDETAVSDVQSGGRLIYRGHPIEALVDQPFARVASLVVTGKPDDGFEALLADAANLDERETALVLALPADLHAMRVLQCLVPVMSASPDLGFDEADQGLFVAARLPAVTATHLLRRPVQMDPGLSYAERFLAAIGTPLEPELVTAFNMTQILQIEHSFNAGTFAARVVASTLARIDSAIAAGIGALSGELHGGADQAVLEIADTLSSVDAASTWVDQLLAEGGKVPGMGHREYRVRDPRALFLEQWADKLSRGTEHAHTFALLQAIDARFRERMLENGKEVHANVEFYKGLVYRVLGLPNQFFTAGFAMARAFGYVAHFIESRRDNRIFRPAARYVGP